MSVEIARRVQVAVSDAVVRQAVMGAMRHGRAKGDVSVAFVGPARMRVLNRTYHEEDRVTDVLAFPAGKREERKTQNAKRRIVRQNLFLPLPRGGGATCPGPRVGRGGGDFGELVICPSYVNAQAKRAGEPFRRELTRVLVHGTLHLLGHDHATPREAEKMFAVQERLVHSIAV
ncbi:MAG: rRNA maturation RNase YbeY [bacterium]|nr:rRNA maturation RNase YbeY [bacterium]